MSDLISREALCEYALNQKDKSITPNDIMRFPSAQPKKRTEERTETHACDLISRQAAIDAVRSYYDEFDTSDKSIEERIEDLPSVQSARMNGEWITNLYAFGDDRYECNQCHNTARHCYDFCPNCGADMRGEQDG